ncbi:hypothetical protein DL95DRAFT_460622 [Leptodontidium sp. 2 PMI_412]|nr:hypothetical protein DL95DRAFT_460622 [Leptodontidium sp. 2 PMI_412]
MEKYWTILLPKHKVVSEIIYYLALWTFSTLFAYFVFFICLGCTVEDHLSRRSTTKSQTVNSKGPLSGNSHSINKLLRVNERDEKKIEAEEATLKTFREVYKDRGVEDACVLDTSESDVDERDSLFNQMKEELGYIGHRGPTRETDNEGR